MAHSSWSSRGLYRRRPIAGGPPSTGPRRCGPDGIVTRFASSRTTRVGARREAPSASTTRFTPTAAAGSSRQLPAAAGRIVGRVSTANACAHTYILRAFRGRLTADPL